mgnify:CR=1 FL=1
MAAGVGTSLRLTDKTSLNFDAATTTHKTPFSQTQDVLDLRLDHTFANNQRVSLRGRYTMDRERKQEKDLALVAEYSIPFGLPITRKTSTGSVTGYVYDA